jgi:hypothetical protein
MVCRERRREPCAPRRAYPMRKLLSLILLRGGVESDITSLVLPIEPTLRKNYSSACDAASLAAPHLNY